MTDMGIIGGADGPTVVVLSKISWLNVFGLIIMAIMMLPNIVFALKYRDAQNKCRSRLMNVVEQIGRFSCMLLMVFNIGLADPGFRSFGAFLAYFIGNAALLLAYLAIWLFYFKRPALWNSLALAVLPTLIFLLSGITLSYWPLTAAAVLFGVGHIYVTVQNAREL